MHVTIATAPCSWGVWYQDGKPSGTPYETFLSQAAEADTGRSNSVLWGICRRILYF